MQNIGIVGAAVMGSNLALNMANHGFSVAVFSIDPQEVQRFVQGPAKGKEIVGAYTLESFVEGLQTPRRILMMIKAGSPVDEMIDKLLPLLSPGDILIDGGNSHFPDTIRRVRKVEDAGMLYIGMGISGGEEGALNGPSLMPGGSKAAWPYVKEILQTIAAHTDEGEACCDWIGEGGAGHFVKMVHNGIEYGDMQLICEAYQLMRDYLGMTADEMHETFAAWNRSELDSYLIEITADILAYKDTDGAPLVERILDSAGQKGTGKWTAVAALDESVPLTLIGEAVFSRFLSAMKEERVAASKVLRGPQQRFTGDRTAFLEQLRQALYAAKIVSYAQGYALMRAAAQAYGWNLNYGGVALMWRGGCIIRSAFLGKIKEAFERDAQLQNLLLDPYFQGAIESAQAGWRQVCASALIAGIPVPAMTSALGYYDGYRTERLPANLLQAQRDYFGAHTYERVDHPRGEFFHTNWTGHGGDISASIYNA